MRAAGAGASACSFFFLRFFFDGVAASSVKTFMGDGAGAAAFSRIAASLAPTRERHLAELIRHRRDGQTRDAGHEPRGPAFY